MITDQQQDGLLTVASGQGEQGGGNCPPPNFWAVGKCCSCRKTHIHTGYSCPAITWV